MGPVSLFVFLACRAAGASTVSSASLTLAGYLVGVQILTMRSQLIGVLLFAVIQWVVVMRRGSPQRLWLVPVLTFAWANVHGSFVLAFVLLGFAWLEDYAAGRAKARRVATVAAVSAIATLVNPFGIRVWSYVADVVGNPTVAGRVANGPRPRRVPRSVSYSSSPCSRCSPSSRPPNHEPRGERYSRSPSSLC